MTISARSFPPRAVSDNASRRAELAECIVNLRRCCLRYAERGTIPVDKVLRHLPNIEPDDLYAEEAERWDGLS